MSDEPEQRGGHGTAMDEITQQAIRETLARPDVAYNIGLCATLLDLLPQTVHGFVNRNPELAALCPGKNPERLVPTETAILDREPPPGSEGVILPRQQMALMRDLVKKNDKVIRDGWKSIGLSDEDSKAMDEAEARARMPIGRILGASEGHLISMLARSARILDKIGDQLMNGGKSTHGPLPKITDVAGSDKTEVEYLKVYQAGVMTHVNIQQTLLKTRAATLSAMKQVKELSAESQKPAKGVFTPTPPKNATPNNE